MKSVKKPPVAVIAASVLLCLVLVSMSMTAGIFARYTSKADIPENSARTAAFSVSAEAVSSDPVSIIANGTDSNGRAEYIVRIKNSSETAVRYEAQVNFLGDADDHNEEKFSGDPANNLTFTGFLDPNGEDEKTVTLDMSEYFELNDKWSTFSNDDISGESGRVPFNVDVRFTQVN